MAANELGIEVGKWYVVLVLKKKKHFNSYNIIQVGIYRHLRGNITCLSFINFTVDQRKTFFAIDSAFYAFLIPRVN